MCVFQLTLRWATRLFHLVSYLLFVSGTYHTVAPTPSPLSALSFTPLATCYIPNSTWIPKVFPSHSRVISVSSLSHPWVLPSTLKYSQLSWVKPEPVHLPSYTRILCIPPSLAPSLLRDFGILALYYSLYTLYTRNWHTSEFLSFWVHIPFHPLCILVPLWTHFGSSDLRFLWGSVTATQHSHSSGTLPQNLVPLAFLQFSL